MTTDDLKEDSVWDLIKKLAEAENMIVYISQDGKLYFNNKTTTAGTEQFHFSGIGDSNKTYGHNLTDNVTVYTAYKKIYNRINIEYSTGDKIVKEEDFTYGDNSSSDNYGVRTYDITNEYMSFSKAKLVSADLYDEYRQPKQEVKIISKFVPQLSINDTVTLTHNTERSTGVKWGQAICDTDLWGIKTKTGINIKNKYYNIISIQHNLDKCSTTLELREI